MDEEIQLNMLQEKLQSTSSLVDDDFLFDKEVVENFFTKNSTIDPVSNDITSGVEDSFNSDGKFYCSYVNCKALFWSAPCEICKKDGLIDMCFCEEHHEHEVHKSTTISIANNSLPYSSEQSSFLNHIDNSMNDYFSVYALLKAIPQVYLFVIFLFNLVKNLIIDLLQHLDTCYCQGL